MTRLVANRREAKVADRTITTIKERDPQPATQAIDDAPPKLRRLGICRSTRAAIRTATEHS